MVALWAASSGACTRDIPDAGASSRERVGCWSGAWRCDGGCTGPTTSASASASALSQVGADSGGAAPLHKATQEELLALIWLPERKSKAADFGPFLRKAIGPGRPSRANQGNPELARHDIARAGCLAGLEGVRCRARAEGDLRRAR